MKKLCMLTAAALALMLLAGCSAQEEETEPLPESMDQETVLAAGEEILNQLLDGEYEAVYGEFREDIRADLTVESVQELIESETQEAGTYEGIEKADTIGSTEGEEHGIARFLCNFSEEDVEFADRTALRATMQRIAAEIDRLRSSFALGNAIREGVAVAIAGAPNVGKSTLLNRLLNEERAMVSEIAGTTRDVIEECANIGGVLFRFLDTAGIRPTDDRLEQMGIQRTMSSIERARIVIHMVDASTLTGPVPAPDFPLRPGQKLLTVVNKTDKAPAAWRLPEGVVGISAKHGEGIDALCDALRESVDTEALYHGDPVVSNSRHYEALSAAREALGQALDGLAHGLPTDLLSEEIRQVITHLGAITGRGAIAPDEILQNIFSKFCIGK